MKLFGWRIDVVLLAFGLGLLLALGGQALYLRWQVEAPLVEELAAWDGVDEVHLETGPGGARRVRGTLGPEARLIDGYAPLTRVVEERLGGEAAVVLADGRSPELTAAWDRLGFTVQEGAATGELETMRRRVEAWAASRGLASQLFVDDQHIYVTLRDQEHYLHEVIRRQDGAGGLPGRGKGEGG